MKNLNLLYLLMILIFFSCADDKDNFSTGIGVDEQTVEMTFSALSLTYSQPQEVENDKEVLKLDLVVCKEGIYQYTRPAYTSDYATFRSTLKIDEGVDIYFFANTNLISENEDILIPGDSWQEIHTKLFLTQTHTIINNKTVLPMWGQLKDVTISEHKVNNFGQIRLLRSVASTNVYFDLKKGLSFTPKVAYIYFAADKAFAALEEENLIYSGGLINGVKEPISPSSMKTNVRIKADIQGNSIENVLYMFDNSTTEFHKEHVNNRRTRLVVGGNLEDSDELTYYPLDFFESGTEDLLPVTRNDQYNLTITAVNSEGYPDPDEAAENAAVNLDYKVINWNQNEDSDIGVEGNDYLSVSSKEVILYPNRGAKATVNLSGTFEKEEITISLPNATYTESSTSNTIVQNNRFKIEMTGEGTEFTLTFTALEKYDDQRPQMNKGMLHVQAGRIQYSISIEQIATPGWLNGGNKDVDF